MDITDASTPLPSDLSQVFKDYKEILQMHRFHTPLQRANLRQQQQIALALSQKQILEAQHVHSLLPPGHLTRLNVNFYAIVRRWSGEVELSVPVTLVGQGEELWVMYTNSRGFLKGKAYREFESALRDFEAFVRLKPGKASVPKYILKRQNEPATSFSSMDLARTAWLSTPTESQLLQQYIHPYTKAATLVRAHWTATRNSATYYFISQDLPTLLAKPRQSSVLEQVPELMKRSTSEPKVRGSSVMKLTSNLLVQRVKTVPLLEKMVKDSAKLLQHGLQPREVIAEAVFDFMSDQQHQWVFLACKGYTLARKTRLKVATLEQKQEINASFLFYPLVARRTSINHKVSHSLLLSSISVKRRKAVIPQIPAFSHVHKDQFAQEGSAPALLKSSSRCSSLTTPTSSHKVARDVLVPDTYPSDIMGREVDKYDRILEGMRTYKASAAAMHDYVQKYGGIEFWQSHVNFMLLELLKNPDYGGYFDDNVNIEGCYFIKQCILRILRGNYNFYYKETLGKLHAKCRVAHLHYSAFLIGVEGLMEGLPIQLTDKHNIMRRFKELQNYICTV